MDTKVATNTERIDASAPELESASIEVKTTRSVATIPVKSKYFSELVINEGTAIIQCVAKLTIAHNRITGSPEKIALSTEAAIATRQAVMVHKAIAPRSLIIVASQKDSEIHPTQSPY